MTGLKGRFHAEGVMKDKWRNHMYSLDNPYLMKCDISLNIFIGG